MNTIYLHGGLGKRFGKTCQIKARSSNEIIKGLDANYEGFVSYIVQQELRGNKHYMLAKHPKKIKSQKDFIKNIIDYGIVDREVHIVPSVHGGFVAGWLVGFSFIGKTAAAAMSSALWGGLAQLAIGALQKGPEDTKRVVGKKVETRSYLLGASREAASQGGSIPLGYGRLFAGPKLIGQSMKTTRMTGSKYLESSTELKFYHLISEGPIDGPVNEYGAKIMPWSGSGASITPNPDLQKALFINENQLQKGEFFNYNLNESGTLPLLNINNKESVTLENYVSNIITYNQELFGVSPYFGNKNKELITVSEALGDYSGNSNKELPNTFSHKVSNINVRTLIINFRANIFVTRQHDGENLPENAYFAIIVLGDDGERRNILDHPDKFLLRFRGDELVDENNTKLGVFKDNSGRLRVRGIATAAYQFEFPIKFVQNFTKNTPTVQILKLSKETDISAASNVYTTWTTTRKRSWGRKKIERHERTDWNSIGGQGRSRSISVANIEERMEGNLLYPNCATSKIVIDSLNFSNQPTFFWHLRMKKVLIPSNYNASTKKYDGPWNGLFKGQSGYGESIYSIDETHKQWTDNPAWIFYDLLSNPTYGCGKYGVEEFDIDKWQLYKIGKYCDEFVETNYPIQTDSGLLQSFEFSESGPERFEDRTFAATDKVGKFKIKIDNLSYYKNEGDLLSHAPTEQGFELYYEYNDPGSNTLTIPKGVTQVEILTIGAGGSGQVAEYNTQKAFSKHNGNHGENSSVSVANKWSITSYGGSGGGGSFNKMGGNEIDGSIKILARVEGSSSSSFNGEDLRGSSDGGFLIPGSFGSKKPAENKSSSTPGYGAGSASGSNKVLEFTKKRFTVEWHEPNSLGISSGQSSLKGGGSGGSAYSRFNVADGDVLNIQVGEGGASVSKSVKGVTWINGYSVSGKGGRGRVIVRYITSEITSLSAREQFINSFGQGDSFKGKSVAFFIHKHNHGVEALNYKAEIKEKSVLKQSCIIERRQIIESDPDALTVTLSGDNFRNLTPCFSVGNTQVLYGACAAEIDHPIVEHRFSANLFLKQSADAINFLNVFAKMFRAKLSYSSGQISLQQDYKSMPIQLFNNNNVSREGFIYSGSQKSERFSVVKVMFNNKDNEFNQEYIYEEDTAAIQKIGLIETEINALSVSSESEARRLAKWVLASSQYEQEVVKFTVGQEGAYTFPGAIIEINDAMRSTNLKSGRILDIENRDGRECFVLDKSVIDEPILDPIELTVAAGLDSTNVEKISARASSEKSESDQDFELKNLQSEQMIRFEARLIPDLNENKSIALDLKLKMQIDLDVNKGIFNCVYHNLKDGEKVTFASEGLLPGGMSPFVEYFVIDSSLHSFKVSLTEGGKAVIISDTGRDRLLNLGGDHFVIPSDYAHTETKVKHIMIGSVYSMKGDMGLVENNRNDITQSQLSNIGVSSSVNEGWVDSSIFGKIRVADRNWIYVKNLGWMHVSDVFDRDPDSEDYFWFYSGYLGWIGAKKTSNIWSIPSLNQYDDQASGFVSVFYEQSSGEITSFFVHYKSGSTIDSSAQTYKLGGINRRVGREFSIIGVDVTNSGYWVDVAGGQGVSEEWSYDPPSDEFNTEKYFEIDVTAARKINPGQSMHQKNSVILEVRNDLNIDLMRNYNVIIKGVGGSGFDTKEVNKSWFYSFVNETSIEIVDSENLYSSFENLDFNSAKIYLLKEFQDELKSFVSGKKFRVLNTKEMSESKFEVVATEYSLEKFEAIDKKGVVRRPVIPIPPQEGMDVPEAPTELILTSSTIE